MKDFKSLFKFNKRERSGIFFLLLIIVTLLLIQVGLLRYSGDEGLSSFSVDSDLQEKIDSLKSKALKRDTAKIYPFNPNYINDFKGYQLGMSTQEIDRLVRYRKQGQYVNSDKEFQRVTLISDSLLELISPYFKFPEWATQKGDETDVHLAQSTKGFVIKDVNKASVEDLQTIYGIGPKLSNRIIKFRDRLGGFLINDQLYDVYGLEPDVVKNALKRYQVINKPDIKKININTASAQELAQLVYLRSNVARRIVAYRNLNDGFRSLDELTEIEDFPSEKIDRIKLYLTL